MPDARSDVLDCPLHHTASLRDYRLLTPSLLQKCNKQVVHSVRLLLLHPVSSALDQMRA